MPWERNKWTNGGNEWRKEISMNEQIGERTGRLTYVRLGEWTNERTNE